MTIKTRLATERLRIQRFLPFRVRRKFAVRNRAAFSNACAQGDIRAAARAIRAALWVDPEPKTVVDFMVAELVPQMRAAARPGWFGGLQKSIKTLERSYDYAGADAQGAAEMRFTLCVLANDVDGAVHHLTAHDLTPRLNLKTTQFGAVFKTQLLDWVNTRPLSDAGIDLLFDIFSDKELREIFAKVLAEGDVHRVQRILRSALWRHSDPLSMMEMAVFEIIPQIRKAPQPGWLGALRKDLAAIDHDYADADVEDLTKAQVRFHLKVLREDTQGAMDLVKTHPIAPHIDLTSTQFASETIRQLRIWSNSDDLQIEDFKALWRLRIRSEHPAIQEFTRKLRDWIQTNPLTSKDISDLWALEMNERGVVKSVLLRKEIDLALSFGQTGPEGEELKLVDPGVFAEFTAWSKTGRSATDRLSEQARHMISALQSPSQALTASHGQAPRVLFVSRNWKFLRLPAGHVEAAGLDVRFLDFALIEEVFKTPGDMPNIFNQTHSFLDGVDVDLIRATLRERAPVVADLLDWADVVFCEWFDAASIWMSRYLPEDKKLIVRLHSYEAFSHQLFHANLQRLDGLVFIAPHIKEIFEAVIGPELAPGCPSTVISNARELEQFHPLTRSGAALKTLGMTQFASLNKDPQFALDVLEALLQDDPEWQLRCVGNGWTEGVSDAQTAYQEAFEARVQALGDRVVFDGFQSDMPAWYQQIGYILSTSHREGSHESLVEGMLTGAVPALRKWPMVAHFGAPESVFPGLNAFETAQELAAHIAQSAEDFEVSSAKAVADIDAILRASDPARELPEFIHEVLKAEPHKGTA